MKQPSTSRMATIMISIAVGPRSKPVAHLTMPAEAPDWAMSWLKVDEAMIRRKLIALTRNASISASLMASQLKARYAIASSSVANAPNAAGFGRRRDAEDHEADDEEDDEAHRQDVDRHHLD